VKTAGTVLLMAGAIASLVYAPSAVAQPDLAFCRDMAAVGFRSDCATLASLAKDVCGQYDRGVGWEDIVTRLDAQTKNEGLTNYVIAGAPLYFCPQHQGKT
jgi:Protein of unknown function (DUF732)